MFFAVTFCFMLLQHRPHSHFLGPVTVASRPLRTFLYVFILPLLLCAYTPKMFFPWHLLLFHFSFVRFVASNTS
jgi:hypothetical protein